MILFILLFFSIMAAAAVYDLASYTIPNFLPLLLIALFAVYALWQPMPWMQLADHAGAGIAMLAVSWALFTFGFLGGGDAKLFAAASLWMGWSSIVNYLIIFSLCGGILALGILLFRRAPLSARLSRHGWVRALHDKANGVPYGVALAAGAILVMPPVLA